jgi:hypothetical protein
MIVAIDRGVRSPARKIFGRPWSDEGRGVYRPPGTSLNGSTNHHQSSRVRRGCQARGSTRSKLAFGIALVSFCKPCLKLDEVLTRSRYARRAKSSRDDSEAPGVTGHRLLGTFGKVEIAVPRARLNTADGKTPSGRAKRYGPISAAHAARQQLSGPKTDRAVDGCVHQCPPALIVQWTRITGGMSLLSLHSRLYGREH